ncbi:MAG: hypothetical protein OXC26_06650 [Albidovulum sp.]|nr:hypothetical protein [Albidovulum sp.]
MNKLRGEGGARRSCHEPRQRDGRRDAAVAGLLAELTRTVVPGTDLRMVYELPARAEESDIGGRESPPPQHPRSGCLRFA